MNLYSQCMCGKIKFRLILTDLEFKNDETNYLIKTIVAPNFLSDEKGKKFKKSEISGDTVNFQFSTHGGIDTLTFSIKNLTTKTEMLITVLNMTYDNPYFIDLTIFSSGHFFFDWRKIDKCQKENLTTELIECDGIKFYQLQLVNKKDINWNVGFVHNKIRPFDIYLFGKSN